MVRVGWDDKLQQPIMKVTAKTSDPDMKAVFVDFKTGQQTDVELELDA